MKTLGLQADSTQWSGPTAPARQKILFEIGRNLQAEYGSLLSDPLPDRIDKLLRQLEERQYDKRRQTMAEAATSRVALVVEKDDEARHLAGALLEETELAVEEVADASSAYSFLSSNAPRVALVVADGRTAQEVAMTEGGLANLVTHRWPWIRVVLLFDDLSDQREEISSEVTLLSKPWRALDVLVEADRAVRTELPLPSEEAANLWR